MAAKPCSVPKRVRIDQHNSNGNGDSDSASDSDHGSDDDVVHEMKMKMELELEHQNETNRNANDSNNNNNNDNNNNVQCDWIKIFANKTDNTCLCAIVTFMVPCDVIKNLIFISKSVYERIDKPPDDKELEQIESQLNNTQIANIIKIILDRSDYPKDVRLCYPLLLKHY